MRIPSELFSVNIVSSAGVRLHEYKQTTSGDTTTCYIESSPGQEWRLASKWDCLWQHRGRHDWKVKVTVDGKVMESMLFRRIDEAAGCAGVRSQATRTIRPFVFSTLETGGECSELDWRSWYRRRH